MSTPDRFQYHGSYVGQHHYRKRPREHQGPGIPLLVAHDGVDPAADGHYFSLNFPDYRKGIDPRIAQTEGNPQAAASAAIARKNHNFQAVKAAQISKGGVMMKRQKITQLCAIAAFWWPQGRYTRSRKG